MYEESIYNLIPKEYVPPPKAKKYRSRHNPKKPPTGSTFVNHTTSRPGVGLTAIFFTFEDRQPRWQASGLLGAPHASGIAEHHGQAQR